MRLGFARQDYLSGNLSAVREFISLTLFDGLDATTHFEAETCPVELSC
jgi:hypothetical protein